MIGRHIPHNRRIGMLAWLALALLVCAGGCKRAKAPVVAAAPPPPVVSAEPVSVPQVTNRLPPPQPIPPEAIPREPEIATTPEPEPEPAQAPRTTQRPRQAASGPATVTPPPAPQTPTPAAPAGPPPQLRPVFPGQEERELRDRIERSLASAEQLLARVASDPGKRSAVARVRSFIKQAEQARDKGDLNRARSLAERAVVLGSDLARTTK